MSRRSCWHRPIALSMRTRSSGSMRAFVTNPMLSKLARQAKLATLGSGNPKPDGPGVAMSLADVGLLRTVATEARFDGTRDIMVIVGPGRNFAFCAQAALRG